MLITTAYPAAVPRIAPIRPIAVPYRIHNHATPGVEAPSARRIPMSLVFSDTIDQKIASTRNTLVNDTIPKMNRTNPVSFLTALIIVALSSSQVRTWFSIEKVLGTSPTCFDSKSV